MSKNLIEELKWRNMIYDISPGTEEMLIEKKISAYIGFDATAESLHVGNLAAIMLLRHFQKFGGKPIILLGGATTMIGDPGGKKEERILMPEEEIRRNELKIKSQFAKFLEFDRVDNSAEILNNYEWFKDYKFISFLRDIGKHISVPYMLAKESVKKRLETGISFAEFSYQLLQGYDFLHLYKTKNVQLQIGGSDQWGNLTTGIELIRRKVSGQAYALTTPLITKNDGTKFGKTESGTIWLDPKMTSPYKFYQFWLNSTDIDAQKFIKIFTDLNEKEINNLVAKHLEAPEKRLLQKALAKEITILVHSEADFISSEKASSILFSKDTNKKLVNLDHRLILEIFEDVPNIILPRTLLKEKIDPIVFLTDATRGLIFKSKSEARRLLKESAVQINKSRISETHLISEEDLLKDRYIMIQKGKKNYYLVIFK